MKLSARQLVRFAMQTAISSEEAMIDAYSHTDDEEARAVKLDCTSRIKQMRAYLKRRGMVETVIETWPVDIRSLASRPINRHPTP